MSELLEIQTFSTDRIGFAGVVFVVFFLLSAFFLSSCRSVTLKAQNQGIRNFRRIPVLLEDSGEAANDLHAWRLESFSF